MKKVILSLVFVLATGSMMNATSSKEISYQESCFEKANRLTNVIAINTNMDLGYDYVVFSILYDECMGGSNGEFVFPE